MTRTTDVEIEMEGVMFSVDVELYAPRKESPDAWWRETGIRVIDEKANLEPVLQYFASANRWDAYDEMTEKIEQAIIEQEEIE